MDALTAEMLGVMNETVQSEFVGLWLRATQSGNTPDSTQPASTPLQ